MTSAFKEIPVIDIGGLYSEDEADRKAVAAEMRDAAEHVGFMYIKGHHISPETIEDLRSAAKTFFALPMEEKMKYYIGNSKSHKGYVPEGEEIFNDNVRPDHKEAMDIGRELPEDDTNVLAGRPFFGNNMWPENMPEYKTKVLTYMNQALELGDKLSHGFGLALGLDEKVLDRYFQDPIVTFRLIHYPLDETAEDAPGIGEHTDYEWFTLLLADESGLQVMNSEGEWIEAPPKPGAFILNIGNVLEIATNARFVATAHRVRKVKEERYSFPMFYGSSYGTVIQPLPEFEHEVKRGGKHFEPVPFGDYLWSAVIHTYRYLIERQRNGTLVIPEGVPPLSAFGPAGLSDHTKLDAPAASKVT